MNENAKTITLVTIAAALALIAWISRPGQWTGSPNKAVGEKLTADFDPLSAASMEITEYDESTATVHPFQVALVDFKGKSRWSIPSHSDYPADAEKQVANAATALMGLQILSVEGDTPADHEKFGVVDPDLKTLKAGASGVGMRVTIRDKNSKDLLSLVIGKEVPGRPTLRYVRRAGQDPIYTAAISTANLSTNFDKWIEKNILKMNAWDLDRLWVRDYSTALAMDEQGQVGVERENRGEIVLQYNDQGEPRWKLIEDRKVNKDGTLSPVKMADDEELNVAKIDELKNALDDLKIVDVLRKPEGISADLKASADFTNKKEAFLTLAARGFIVAMTKAGGDVEICSKEGEVRSLMKDGVEYVLRFGEIAAGSDTGTAKQDEKDKDQKEGPDKGGKKPAAGQNRYLFVMADFIPDAIPKPKLEPLPEAKPEAENKPAAGSKQAVKPEEKLAEAKDATKVEEKPVKAKAAVKAEGKAAESKENPAIEKGVEKAGEKIDIQAERQRIEKENKRKQDEYEEKLAAGKKHAQELNARFADWYYIISDDVYLKIRLGHDDIIKKKEKKDAKTGNSDSGDLSPTNPTIDLNSLQQQGPGGKEKP
ncbi:MAG: DUF4340 domain-containing protein [Thermoguttaceae bacterium]